MRVVFAGTPQTAVPSLEALLASRHDVVAVITRPDAAAGRGRHVGEGPVARRAREAGLPVLKPPSPREPGFLERLRQVAPDCCPVTAYGALIPKVALDVPQHGWVNLHFSLLPAWRGAAPVQHALLHGDDITGATTFLIVPELDAGPVYGTLTEPIRPDDTAGDLLARLAAAGAALLARTLDGIESGELVPVPQPAEGISLAPKLTPDDARVRWHAPAHVVGRQIRACTPAPGAWAMLGEARLKLWPVRVPAAAPPPAQGLAPPPPEQGLAAPPPEQGPAAPPPGQGPPPQPAAPGTPPSRGLAPGELLATQAGVFAGTGSAPVQLGDVQQAGKRRMTAAEWARGLRLHPGHPAVLS